VPLFLEQCLCSVREAIGHIKAEVIVVDNHSSNQSLAYLQPLFPWVHFIANTENLGFAKANNQAVAIAKGEYCLFLNPDTLVAEDCFEQCLGFLRAHQNAGGLGIRMIDGSGQFLPESKRAFPSAITAFYKLVGLSALFPKSRLFNKYSLGYLNPNENQVVDVLAGAFFMVSSKILATVGSFDERFFMYAEDIDLSYRIQQAGFTNYYYSGSTIIHFKGESTRKGSLNYVLLFYNAMRVFVIKNYKGKSARVFSFFIQIAIVFRGFFSLVNHLILRLSHHILSRLTPQKVELQEVLAFASHEEFEELRGFLTIAGVQTASLKQVFPNTESFKLQQKTTLVFCQGPDFSWKQVIAQTEKMANKHLSLRFHAKNSLSIIGSDSKETSGEALANSSRF
jgi:GT2 family glycosyltransferase